MANIGLPSTIVSPRLKQRAITDPPSSKSKRVMGRYGNDAEGQIKVVANVLDDRQRM